MSENIYFIDAVSGSPDYNSAAYAKVREVETGEGVAPNYLNELEVITGAGLQVIVKDGAMTSKGRTYIQDEPSDGGDPLILSIDAATTGYLRKDVVVVEYDLDSGAALAKIVKGTQATSSPSKPTWTDSGTLWKRELAVVNIDGGSIDSIEDGRTFGGARSKVTSFADDYCYLQRSTGLSTATSAVLWNTEVSDENDMHDPDTNPERITIQNSGTYLICSTILLGYTAGTTSGDIILSGQLKINGSTVQIGSGVLINTANLDLTREGYSTMSCILQLSVSDYIEIHSLNNFNTTPLQAGVVNNFITVQRVA